MEENLFPLGQDVFIVCLIQLMQKIIFPLLLQSQNINQLFGLLFFFDLHFLILLFPVGLYFCFKNLTDESLFIICYAVTSVYFTGVMVRLMLVFAPVVCILSGIALSSILEFYIGSGESMKKKFVVKEGKIYYPIQKDLSKIVSFGILLILCWYVYHCTWITSEAYSSPSIVLAARQQDGSQVIFDDFRGAYRWLNYNTPPDARIMSWWDYGYQITAMANRTVLVDNNTWNNTHIATVGKAMASTEEVAYPIMLSLDVDYVLVIFGGVIGYASDDINKFLWMVRIGGGVYPEIKEIDYFNSRGEYRVDVGGSKVFLRSLMYKLSYYRFGELKIDLSTPPGFDRVRGVEIGNKKIKLKYLEEVYTSEHWLVRIYKVKKLHNRH
jgi:dolichyl-diphosphooligosaccharide--protein glycosyltransferase